MNIAHVSPRYLPAELRGGERYIQILSECLAARHSTTVLTSNAYALIGNLGTPGSYYLKQKSTIIKDVRVIRFPVFPLVSTTLKKLEIVTKFVSPNHYAYEPLDYLHVLGWGPFTPSMYSHIVSSNYDFVHAAIWPTTTLLLSFYACKKYRIPFAITPAYHFRLADFTQSTLLPHILHFSTAIIALTEIERRELLKIGSPPERTFAIPLSLDLSSFSPGNYDLFRQEYGLQEKFVVLAHPWMSKGGGDLLVTMKELSKSFSNLALVTLGAPDKEYLQMLYAMSPLDFTVLNLGWVCERKKYDAFAASDVFVMPTLSNAFGMVYLEAWASGKPIIGSRNTAAEDIIRHGQDGLLVENSNIEDLKSKLSILLLNRKLAADMGQKGRRRVEQEFSTTVICPKFEKALIDSLELSLPY